MPTLSFAGEINARRSSEMDSARRSKLYSYDCYLTESGLRTRHRCRDLEEVERNTRFWVFQQHAEHAIPIPQETSASEPPPCFKTIRIAST